MPEIVDGRNPVAPIVVSSVMAHTAHIEPSDKTWTVTRNGTVVARTSSAVMVHEHYNGSDLPPVPYIPPSDVEVGLTGPTGHSTTCPVKGTAGYYSVDLGDGSADELANSVWFYPEPISPLEPIAGYVSFYGDRYDITAS